MINTQKQLLNAKLKTEKQITKLEKLLNSDKGRVALDDRCSHIIGQGMPPVLLLDTPDGLLYGARDVERLLGLSLPRQSVRRLLPPAAVSLRAVPQPDNPKCHHLCAFIAKDGLKKLIAAATHLTENQRGTYSDWLLCLAPILVNSLREMD